MGKQTKGQRSVAFFFFLSLFVVIVRLDNPFCLFDHHWPALVFAPGEPDKFACRLTVFEPHWLSLFCAPGDHQLGLTFAARG